MLVLTVLIAVTTIWVDKYDKIYESCEICDIIECCDRCEVVTVF